MIEKFKAFNKKLEAFFLKYPFAYGILYAITITLVIKGKDLYCAESPEEYFDVLKFFSINLIIGVLLGYFFRYVKQNSI